MSSRYGVCVVILKFDLLYKKFHSEMYIYIWKCRLQNGGNFVQSTMSNWRRDQMETFSALLALSAGNSSITSDFPAQRPMTRIFDVFFHLCLNKRQSKPSWGWWFDTPSCSLWRYCNERKLIWSLFGSVLKDTSSSPETRRRKFWGRIGLMPNSEAN